MQKQQNSTSILAIINAYDVPVFQCYLNVENSENQSKEDTSHLNEMILYASMDNFEEYAWQTSNLFLSQIDRFNDSAVSAYITPTHVKFLLLHRVTKGTSICKTLDNNISKFFTEIHTLYLKILMNPFYEVYSPLNFTEFESKIQFFAKKYLLNS
ncbi:trafficking protein particle complex subunit 2-like [Hylaeus volcanicus]|uniref:trafficking protein particle complex subunit 2-like n=1 Tax=Hylaeus volcanicus TaxID=313075 RepID=UPI0023B79138|nr:trafficking protein particle complex subunit 2-like [Hylaeus volcanicus]